MSETNISERTFLRLALYFTILTFVFTLGGVWWHVFFYLNDKARFAVGATAVTFGIVAFLAFIVSESMRLDRLREEEGEGTLDEED